MRTTLLLASLSFLVAGCLSAQRPDIPLDQAGFAERPVLIERSGHVYLRYRMALDEKGITLRRVLYHKKTEDAAYYFFSVPISHAEWGQRVERPLAYDKTEDLARRKRVFWLDPDGTSHPIPMKKEPD